MGFTRVFRYWRHDPRSSEQQDPTGVEKRSNWDASSDWLRRSSFLMVVASALSLAGTCGPEKGWGWGVCGGRRARPMFCHRRGGGVWAADV